LIVTALVAAGSAWFLTERSTREDLGQPVALDELDPSASTTGSDSGDIARDAVTDAANAAKQPSWLFSLTSTGGTFSANAMNPDIGTMTLTGISVDTVGFTDRPVRDAVTFATDKLPTAWTQMFSDSDPNAVLVTRGSDGTRHTYVLELSSPTVDGTSLTFQVAAIQGKDHSSQLPDMRVLDAAMPPGSFAEATLFIDSVTPPGPHWICTTGPAGNQTQVTPPAPIPFDSWNSTASNQFEAQCFAKKATPSVVGVTN